MRMQSEVPVHLRCSVFIAVSVDGYIARADGSVDWLSVVQCEGEDYGYAKFFDSVDTLVIGRKTYELALGFASWPYEGKRCVVLTQRALTPVHDEESFDGPPEALMAKLALQGVRHVYVDGGAVIQQFLAKNLIDDLTLSLIPVALGSGVRLFGEDGVEQRLVLEDVRSWPTGLTQLTYRLPREKRREP